MAPGFGWDLRLFLLWALRGTYEEMPVIVTGWKGLLQRLGNGALAQGPIPSVCLEETRGGRGMEGGAGGRLKEREAAQGAANAWWPRLGKRLGSTKRQLQNRCSRFELEECGWWAGWGGGVPNEEPEHLK